MFVLHSSKLLVLSLFLMLCHVAAADTDQMTWNATFILEKPFIFPASSDQVHDPKKPTQACPHNFQGFLVDLLDMIGKEANFKFCFRLVADGRYGSQDENGSWSGMVGEVERGEADIAAAPITITSARAEDLVFSHPYLTSGLSVLMRQPTKNLLSKLYEVWFIFQPLRTEAWLVAALLTPCLVALVFFVNNRWNPYEQNSQSLPSRDFAFPRVIYFVLATLSWQGYDRLPRSHAGRLLLVCWLLYVVFFLVLYLAACTSFMLAQKHEEHLYDLPIRSVQDLALQSSYKFGSLQHGATHRFFQDTKLPVLQQMRKKMDAWSAAPGQASVYVSNVEEGLNKARYEAYAFIVEEHTAAFYANRQPCDLAIVDTVQVNRDYGFLVKKEHSTSLKRINEQIVKFTDMGNITTLYAKWWYGQFESSACGTNSAKQLLESSFQGVMRDQSWKDRPQPLDLTVMGGALTLLCLGLVTAAMMMVAERYVYGKGMGQQVREPSTLRLDAEPDDGHL